MKKKLLAIGLCALMLALIPVSVLGSTLSSTSTDPNTTDMGRTMIRGIVFNYKSTGLKTHFFAIRIHYSEITGSETTHGVIRFSRVETGTFLGGYTNDFIMPGFFGYIAGANFRGGITIY